MRGAIRFNVVTHSVAAPMMAAAAQQSHYDQNNQQMQQQLHNSPHQGPHSPWRSPVPYLFGGLAAMLGLIAFALLILACSYWKLSGYLEGGEGGSREGDVEGGQQEGEKGGSSEKVTAQVYEQKIVVIMAGDEKPTYLATPMASRNNSFGDEGKSSRSDEEEGGVSGTASERKVGDGGETSGRKAAADAAVNPKGGENSQVTTDTEEQNSSRQDERMAQ